MTNMWHTFRRNMPIISVLSFIFMFLIPFLLDNRTDAFIFFGGLLSIMSGILVVCSYFGISEWKRHPSSLLLQISVSSIFFSTIIVVYAFSVSTFERTSDNEISAVNLVDSSIHTDERDHHLDCRTISFLIQFVLLAREMWVLTLSLDLITSITNPFASYSTNLRRYHLSIWIASLASALCLLNQPNCQGEFLSNGTCWIKISGHSDNTCFWGYFLGWVFSFYITSALVITYAYIKISKGLESTFATRLKCVKATLWYVMLYFLYGCVIGGLFFIAMFALPTQSKSNLLFIEHIFAYMISCRGFYDALIWFFSHKIEERQDANNTLIGRLSLQKNKKSTNPISRILQWYSSSHEEDSTCDQVCNPMLTQPLDAEDPNPTSTRTAELNQNKDTSSDYDLSPQLNVALRSELLLLVSMGIKESVLRLKRDYNTTTPIPQKAVEESKDPLISNESVAIDDVNFIRNDSMTNSSVNSNTFTNSQSRSHLSGAFQRGGKYHNASRHIMSGLVGSVLGTHIPGDYGVDPLHGRSGLEPAKQTQTTNTVGSTHQEGSHRVSSLRNTSISMNQSYSYSYIHRPNEQLYHNVGDTHVNIGESKVDLIDYNGTNQEGGYSDDCESDLNQHTSRLSSAANDNRQQQNVKPLPPPPVEVVFNIDSKHQFRDFRPLTFQHLRQLSGISEEDYLSYISQPTKERLSEGASGAFFFMCGKGELIVKTVQPHEARTLMKILDKYLKHLSSHPKTMLVRFLGLHSIKMYGNEFMFVVMKNIIPPHTIVNEKYDIKGSWVNRDASAAYSSQTYGALTGGFGEIHGAAKKSRVHTCKHCNQLFNAYDSAAKNVCSAVVGVHEAIITMKDNNMTSKIRLYPDHAFSVIETLFADSDALCDMGVTDYSLLIGVKNMQYDIDQRFQPSPSSSQRRLSCSFSIDQLSQHSDTLQNTSHYLIDQEKMTPLSNNNNDRIPEDGNSAFPARAVIAPCEYYLGVIDMLQSWSYSKWTERIIKVHLLNQPPEGISCMAPEMFKDRFQKKVSRIIEHSIFVREVTGSWYGKREVTEPSQLLFHDTNS